MSDSRPTECPSCGGNELQWSNWIAENGLQCRMDWQCVDCGDDIRCSECGDYWRDGHEFFDHDSHGTVAVPIAELEALRDVGAWDQATPHCRAVRALLAHLPETPLGEQLAQVERILSFPTHRIASPETIKECAKVIRRAREALSE